MNNFDCYPIAFDKQIVVEKAVDDLLSTEQIPIKIIDDRNSKEFKYLQSQTLGNKINFFIVVIVYTEIFEA